VGDGARVHAVTSRLTGRTDEVRVHRRVVDTTYLEVSVPATHTPSFSVDPDAVVIPVGRLVDADAGTAGFTVLGAGKTAMDACCWLLDNGVDPGRIRWIRPRDAWLNDRASFQQLDLVAGTMEGLALDIECLALAEDVPDLFRRLEDAGALLRLDPGVEPTMYRGAIVSRRELELLRQIDDVVRLGRVRHVGGDRLVLDGGTVPTDRPQVHVDCTAEGFKTKPPRPIFEPVRITLQSMQGGFTPYNAALVGFVEATRDDDGDKNRLCPPIPQPSRATDWIRVLAGAFRATALHSADPDVGAWVGRSRLNLTRGVNDHLDDPRLLDALGRLASHMDAALSNADRLLEDAARSA
jgi:hypothetical protein